MQVTQTDIGIIEYSGISWADTDIPNVFTFPTRRTRGFPLEVTIEDGIGVQVYTPSSETGLNNHALVGLTPFVGRYSLLERNRNNDKTHTIERNLRKYLQKPFTYDAYFTFPKEYRQGNAHRMINATYVVMNTICEEMKEQGLLHESYAYLQEERELFHEYITAIYWLALHAIALFYPESIVTKDKVTIYEQQIYELPNLSITSKMIINRAICSQERRKRLPFSKFRIRKRRYAL